MSERKPDDERVNRNPRVYPSTSITWDGKTRGPECPSDVETQKARDWWDFVRNSPQAILMQAGDWEQMKVALRLYDAMYSNKKVITKTGDLVEVPCTPGELRALSAEWRTYTETYGFTRQSRIRYGISIVDPEEAETEATQILRQAATGGTGVNYRERLGGAQ